MEELSMKEARGCVWWTGCFIGLIGVAGHTPRAGGSIPEMVYAGDLIELDRASQASSLLEEGPLGPFLMSKAQPERILPTQVFPKKQATVFIYIAGRNDLEPFAKHNLEQLMRIPNSEHLNIVVHLHTMYLRRRVTQLLLIKEGQMYASLCAVSCR
jgi:hypothetical protein